MTESILHKELKTKAVNYLWNKGYRIVKAEANAGYYGIYDVWGMNNRMSAIGIEVKVSRADWRNNKTKEKKSLDPYCYVSAEENYILCPEGLIQKEEIHSRWGLLWFKNGRLYNKKKPYYIKIANNRKLYTVFRMLECKPF